MNDENEIKKDIIRKWIKKIWYSDNKLPYPFDNENFGNLFCPCIITLELFDPKRSVELEIVMEKRRRLSKSIESIVLSEARNGELKR